MRKFAIIVFAAILIVAFAVMLAIDRRPAIKNVMRGWTMTTYYPDAAIRADFGAYERQNNLPDDGGATFFYENGMGGHRILIITAGACHVLTYDSNDRRTDVVIAKGNE